MKELSNPIAVGSPMWSECQSPVWCVCVHDDGISRSVVVE